MSSALPRALPGVGHVHLHWLPFAAAMALAPAAAALLTADEQARAGALAAPGGRERFALAHGLLRAVLAGYLDCEPRAVPIRIDPRGKPWLAGEPFAFNMSHCDDCVLVAVARDPVGVDVEAPRPRIDAIAIARRFFAPVEARAVEREGDALFRRLWVCKEAFAKAIGLGLALPLDACVVDAAGASPRLAALPSEWGSREDWALAFWSPDDGGGAIAAVALARPAIALTAFDGIDVLARALDAGALQPEGAR